MSLVTRVMRWLHEVSGLAQAERVGWGRKDPWRRVDLEPPLRAFGPGAVEFEAFLGRASRVSVSSAAEVAEWLAGCRYAHDEHLLGEDDHWLHPVTFELLRCGDCEDFALWGWRKLTELGHDATFVVGVRVHPELGRGRHAWVVFRDGDQEYVLDGVERHRARIIRSVDEVRERYEPQVGVDGTGRRFVFAGLYREDWGRQLRMRRP